MALKLGLSTVDKGSMSLVIYVLLKMRVAVVLSTNLVLMFVLWNDFSWHAALVNTLQGAYFSGGYIN